MDDTEFLDEPLDAEFLDGFPDAETLGNFMGLKASNQEKFQSLTQQGLGFEPVQLLSMQLDALLNILDPEARAAWGVEFETRMRNLLDSAIEQLPRMKLMAPGSIPPIEASGLIKP